MGVKFIEWFFDEFITIIFDSAIKAIKMAVGVMVIVITFPVWFLPFVYWYFSRWRVKRNIDSDVNRNPNNDLVN